MQVAWPEQGRPELPQAGGQPGVLINAVLVWFEGSIWSTRNIWLAGLFIHHVLVNAPCGDLSGSHSQDDRYDPHRDHDAQGRCIGCSNGIDHRGIEVPAPGYSRENGHYFPCDWPLMMLKSFRSSQKEGLAVVLPSQPFDVVLQRYRRLLTAEGNATAANSNVLDHGYRSNPPDSLLLFLFCTIRWGFSKWKRFWSQDKALSRFLFLKRFMTVQIIYWQFIQ